MPDENLNTVNNHIPWDSSPSVSSLDTSESDLSDLRKEIIRFALDYPIHDIRTYAGYKGDLIVEITASKLDVLAALKSYADSIGIETVIKERPTICIHELYCITPDTQIYKLKEPI